MTESNSTNDPGASSGYLTRLRYLTLRLLSDQGTQAREILVGQLPRQWPADIPILQDTRILGSETSSPVPTSGKGKDGGSATKSDAGEDESEDGNRNETFTVVLGTDLAPETILDLYDERLRAAGWILPRSGRPFDREGFISGLSAMLLNYYREGQEQGPGLRIIANTLADGSTEVRLNLHRMPISNFEHPGIYDRSTLRQVVPLLEGPKQSSQVPMGSSESDHHRHSTATLVSVLDAEELASHYAEQLQRAGWTRTDQGISGPLIWSTWEFKDVEGAGWTGTLIIADSQGKRPGRSQDQLIQGYDDMTPDKHDYYLSIYAQRA